MSVSDVRFGDLILHRGFVIPSSMLNPPPRILIPMPDNKTKASWLCLAKGIHMVCAGDLFYVWGFVFGQLVSQLASAPKR